MLRKIFVGFICTIMFFISEFTIATYNAILTCE
jgi:hypothetical protein